MCSMSICFAKEQNIPKNWDLLISKNQISEKIQEVAEKLNKDYKGKDVVLVMVMKGSILFVSDLMREVSPHLTLEYIRCRSYYGGTERKKLLVEGVEKLHLQDKHVLVVDDIFDSGNTLTQVVTQIQKLKPASLQTLVLLNKKTGRRLKDAIVPDFSLFEIRDVFVVGYGLDFDEKFRGLDAIYYIK